MFFTFCLVRKQGWCTLLLSINLTCKHHTFCNLATMTLNFFCRYLAFTVLTASFSLPCLGQDPPRQTPSPTSQQLGLIAEVANLRNEVEDLKRKIATLEAQAIKENDPIWLIISRDGASALGFVGLQQDKVDLSPPTPPRNADHTWILDHRWMLRRAVPAQ